MKRARTVPQHPAKPRRQQPDPFVAGLGTRVHEFDDSEWTVDMLVDDRHSHRVIGSVREIGKNTAAAIAGEMAAVNAGTHPTLPTLEMVAGQFLRDQQPRWKESTYKSNCRAVPRFGALLPLSIDRINPERVLAWHCATKSNRHLSVLSGTMKYAAEQGLVPPGNNPCSGLRKKQYRFKGMHLAESDYARLGQVLGARLRSDPIPTKALMLLALTGARRSEVLESCWFQVTDGGLMISKGKSGPYLVPLCPIARRLLATLPPGQPQDRILRQAGGRLLATDALARRWRRIKRDAGLAPKLRIHDLRHSYASAGLNDGVELTVIGELLGHRDYGSTLYYAHLARQTIRSSSDRVGQRIAEQLKGSHGPGNKNHG